jgi:hypothetical protein
MMNPQDSCLDHYFAAASTSPPCLLSAGWLNRVCWCEFRDPS